MQSQPNQFKLPNLHYPQFQQQSKQPYAALCNREILSPYHAVELYQDGALWIIDEEDPPIEIKLDAQAVQKLRDFLMKPDEQRYQAAYSYQQPMNPVPTPAAKPSVKRLIKRENDIAIAWLLFFWPFGLYMMWKYATWPDTVKGFITLALVALTLILLLHGFA